MPHSNPVPPEPYRPWIRSESLISYSYCSWQSGQTRRKVERIFTPGESYPAVRCILCRVGNSYVISKRHKFSF